MLSAVASLILEQGLHCMQKNKGFKRLLLAGVYALNGIRAALRYEAAFRQEALLALVMLPLAFWLDVSRVERVLLIGVTLLVLIVELLNSALEAIVDRVGTDYNLLSGRAKDMGSGAVLLALLLWIYVWVDVALIGAWLVD
jgi:diacylglycerol kinase (ATP)